MEVDINSLSNVITAAVVGLLGVLFVIGLFRFFVIKIWIVKQIFRNILHKVFPSLYTQTPVHSETLTFNPRVNCQAVVIIENLPKCTTAKDLVKCLGLKEMVSLRKLMKLSVAADKKGQCAGLAVAICPRYCLEHSGILNKHKSDYQGNVIKVKEMRNRKINLKKRVNWLSSESWSQVGMKGRFDSYDDILHSITTKHGYYVIDGGSYVQYFARVCDVVEEAAALGVYKMVMKMKNVNNILGAEVAWCKTYPGFLYMTAGIWSSNAVSYCEDPAPWYTKLSHVLEDPTNSKYIVAIGECGISNIFLPKYERKLFEDMVKLAELHKKPILVKSTNKVDHMLEILDKHPDVIPCLNIGYETPEVEAVDKWIKKGYYLGISAGLWTLKQNSVRNKTVKRTILDVVKTVPLEKLILQSNSPHLTYDSHQMKVDYISKIENTADFREVHQESIQMFNREKEDDINFEPCELMVVVELLASCLNRSPISLTSVLNANAEKFYKFNTL